jgi:hypothetical protein
MTHAHNVTTAIAAVAALPECLSVLLEDDQYPDDITMPDGAYLLSDAGTAQLTNHCASIGERGCFLDQQARIELYAVGYESQHALIMSCFYFKDFVCAYDQALAQDEHESTVHYLFTDYPSAINAFHSLQRDVMRTSRGTTFDALTYWQA